jgi:uncharacterized protein YjbI with pentapeptide repeats
MPQARLNYEDSCRRLHGSYLKPGVIPPMRDHLPQIDDPAPLGESFFRTFVGAGVDLCHLTLPRTFFGRSEINGASICNTDLTESNFCWNDFIEVDFTTAVLARSDLRASVFERVKFVNTDLRSADMRRSSFHDCDFEGALMEGAVLTPSQRPDLRLSQEQRDEITWINSSGPEPNGG